MNWALNELMHVRYLVHYLVLGYILFFLLYLQVLLLLLPLLLLLLQLLLLLLLLITVTAVGTTNITISAAATTTTDTATNTHLATAAASTTSITSYCVGNRKKKQKTIQETLSTTINSFLLLDFHREPYSCKLLWLYNICEVVIEH